MKLIYDISKHQIFSPQDWDMSVTGGLAAVIVKAGQAFKEGSIYAYYRDTMALTHIQHAKERDLPYALYFWIDPNVDIAYLKDMIVKEYQELGGCFIALDFEQYWASWDEWRAWRNGTRKDKPAALPKEKIFTHHDTLARLLVPALSIPVIPYTSKGFIDSYCPGLINTIDYLGYYWHAQYPGVLDPTPSGVWSFMDIAKRWNNLPNPKLPLGITNWTLWQVSSNLFVPGLPFTDMNAMRDDEFEMLFSLPMTTEQRMSALEQRVEELEQRVEELEQV